MRFDEAFNELEGHLIKGFLSLTEKKPYDKVSVKELTATCHVARTSFYRHFEDTLDLLERLEEYLLSELVLYSSQRNNSEAEFRPWGGKPYESIRNWFETGLLLKSLLAPIMGPNGDIYFKERLIIRVREELNAMMDDEGVRSDKRRPYYVASIAASYVGLLHYMVLQPDEKLLSADEIVQIANSTRIAYFTTGEDAPTISDERLFGAEAGGFDRTE